MSRESDVQRVLTRGLVAILRAPGEEGLLAAAEALCEGGIDVIEVTLTVPGALQVIAQVRQRLGDHILLGAGSVLDAESARAALLAGAEFIVAPNVNPEVIRLCRRYGKVVMPGALTPTEVVSAWEEGADFVKIFPADVVGPQYLRALHGPLPQVRLVPTGGVNLETLAEFIRAGAAAVGLGSALVNSRLVAAGHWQALRERAAAYVQALQEVRGKIAS